MTAERIKIEGMGCSHCVSAVKTALQNMEGVDVEAVEIGSARVRYEGSSVDPSALDEAIRAAGYEPVAHEPA